MTAYSDCMVDIETTGTNPAYTQIIQISAVKFNLETQEIGDMFDRCLAPAPHRYWDQGTLDWWLTGPKAEVLEKIMARVEPPEQVLRDFGDWVRGVLPVKGMRVWAKPISFEWPFLASYYSQFGLPMPFHYRYAKDVNTFLYAKGHTDVDAYWNEIGFEGEQHNAIHDVLNQIRGIFKA